MKKIERLTVVCWFSRNTKKMNAVRNICSDFGMTMVQKNVSAGMCTERDIKILKCKVGEILSNTTDIFNVFKMCRTCMSDQVPDNVLRDSIKII